LDWGVIASVGRDYSINPAISAEKPLKFRMV
jgi:hypothetical protein